MTGPGRHRVPGPGEAEAPMTSDAPPMPVWLEAQLPFTRYSVEVGAGKRMHVMEQGEGTPVVLFHGNPTWGYLWRKVAAHLTGAPLRLIMPDLIGLGFSDRPDDPSQHTLSNHADWTATLLSRLGVERPVAVVQDWGGPIGLLGLKRAGMTLGGMVVLNTILGPPKPGFTPTPFHRFFSTRLGEIASQWFGLPQNHLGYAQGDRSSISGIVRRSYAYPLSRDRGNEAVVALVRMVPDDMDHPSVEHLAAVEEYATSFRGRTAIVWGDSDPVLGRMRRRVTRMLPRAAVVATPAGHFLQEEVPSRIAAAVKVVASGS